MKLLRHHILALAFTFLLVPGSVRAADPAKPENATAAALKKTTERYALTKTRIAALLEHRLNPTPMPADLPNPFYSAPVLAPVETAPAEEVVPAKSDLSDADLLARYAATLKISGGLVINGQPLLNINSTLYKAGDVLPVGSKSKPAYLQVLRITPGELTLGYNEAQLVVPLKK
jgi:hypothetical protein